MSAADLATSTTRVKLEGGEAVLVDIQGAAAPGNPMAPFAGSPFSRSPSLPAESPIGDSTGSGAVPSRNIPSRSAPPKEISYVVPEGWDDLPASGMRRASLTVGIGDKKAEITVIPLGGQAGDWLSNVDRWRGQIGLGPTTEDDLAKETKTVDVGGIPSKYVELIGEQQGKTILGVMTVKDDVSWFFKFQGPSSIAADEKEHFEQFIQSTKWNE